MPETILANEPLIRMTLFLGLLGVLAIWEVAVPRRRREIPRLIRWTNNFGVVVLDTVLVRLAFPIVAVGMAILAAERGWGLFNVFEIPFWLAFILSVLALDLAIYLQHVMFHAVPALWRLHRMHHADLEFDVSTGLRFHPIDVATKRYAEIEEQVAKHRPELVILDNIARLFAGNENDRGHVTQFVTLLEHWCVKYGTTILLLGHPSKNGAEYSGSTAWEGAVRSRLYFGRPAGKREEDMDYRILKVGKANLGKSGDEIRLRYRNGCFDLVQGEAEEVGDEYAEAAFLACLDECHTQSPLVNVSHKPRSRTYAPKVFAEMSAASACAPEELKGAMERLQARGEIGYEQCIGKDEHRHQIVGIART